MTNSENPLYSNTFGIPPPASESYNDILFYKRNLEAAFNRQLSNSFQQAFTNTTFSQQDMETLNQLEAHLKSVAEEENSGVAPHWFTTWASTITSEINSMKGDLTSIKNDVATLKDDVATLKDDVATLKDDVVTLKADVASMKVQIYRTNFRAIRSDNRIARGLHHPLEPLPFLDGFLPPDHLPIISNVQDIDNLTKEQCKEYLRGYGITFSNNETVMLKSKLRHAVGFETEGDLDYKFRAFNQIRNSIL